MIRYATGAILTCLLLGASPSPSTSPSPSPMPSATPTARPAMNAFSATGQLGAQATLSGKTVNVQASVTAWARTGLLRLDLQKIAVSSEDAASNAMLAQLLPQGGVSVVFDQKTQMLTFWSSQTRSYYRAKMAFPKPSAKPTPKPKATPRPQRSAIESILKALDSMTQYDVYSQTFELTGHEMVNAHVASVFHFVSRTQKHGGKLQQVSGDLALADDLSGIPVRFAVEADGNIAGNMRIDLVSISTAVPDARLFAVPSGYKKARSLLDLFHR